MRVAISRYASDTLARRLEQSTQELNSIRAVALKFLDGLEVRHNHALRQLGRFFE